MERPALTDLRNILCTEVHRRRNRERARKHAALFSKSIWTNVCSVEEIDQYLRDTCSESRREEDLGLCRELTTAFSTQFSSKELTLAEVLWHGNGFQTSQVQVFFSEEEESGGQVSLLL